MIRDERNNQVDHLESDVNEVTSLLHNNIEKVIARGEKIDSLQERSEELESGSVQFKNAAKNVKQKMCWQNCRLTCIIATVVVAVIVIIIVIVVVELKPWEKNSGHHHNKTVYTESFVAQHGLM